MADEYYTLPTGFLDSLDKRRRQRSLGGQSYDPREMVDATKGAFEAAIARNQTRQKLADDKKYREDVLADTKQGRADTIAANAALQAERLAQNDKQFNITTQNTQDWRSQELDERKSAREDAETGSMINALLKGASLVANDFLRGEADGKGKKEPSLINRASNYFKQLGGENRGSDTGYAAAGTDPNAPDNWDFMPASVPTTPTTASVTPAIGENMKGEESTRDLMSRAYGETQETAKPGKAMTASAENIYATDAGRQIPEIGQPVDQQSMAGKSSDKPMYESTDLATTHAAEPNTSGLGGAAATGGEGDDTSFSPFPNYQAPEFAPFTPPELEPYTPPALPAFNYTTPHTAWTEKQYRDEGGEYGKDWEQKLMAWQLGKQKTDMAAKEADYRSWSAGQNAAARAAYDTWAANELEKAKLDYDQWKEEQSAKAEQEYNAAKSKYGKEVANYEPPGAPVNDKGSWAYNERRLGGPRAVDEYYGNEFSRDVLMSPKATHDFSHTIQRGPDGYYAEAPVPMRAEAEARTPFPVGEFAMRPVASYTPGGESFNYDYSSEIPNYESPYNYASNYGGGYESPVYESYNYEPPDSYGGGYSGGYEAPPSYDYDEPFNYEPGFSDDPSIICCELNRRGYLSDEILAKDAEYREGHISFEAYTGYLVVFSPMVALMKRHTWFAQMIRPFGVAWAKEMASRVDPATKGTIIGKTLLKLGLPVCDFVGRIALRAVATATDNTEVQHG